MSVVSQRGSSSSDTSRTLQQQPQPLQLDLASFPSVLDRPFVMGQPSPYRRSSASGSQLGEIEEEDSDDDLMRSGARPGRSSGTEPRRRLTGLATPPASPLLGGDGFSSTSTPDGRCFALPPSNSSTISLPTCSVSPTSSTSLLPAHRILRKAPPSPTRSSAGRSARSPPASLRVASAGRNYGGRKEVIQEGLKEFKSDVVADPNNVKSPSSTAFWAGLDDDDDL